MEDVLMVDVREAARRLSMGRSAAYVLIQRGDLKSVKIGGMRRVLVSDLYEFVQQLRERCDDEPI